VNETEIRVSDVWLTVHRNSVWIRNQLDVTFVLSFISPLKVVQLVKANTKLTSSWFLIHTELRVSLNRRG